MAQGVQQGFVRRGCGGRFRHGGRFGRRQYLYSKWYAGGQVVGQQAGVGPQRVTAGVQQHGGQQPARPAGHALHGFGAGGLGVGAEGGCFQRAGCLFQRYRDNQRILGAGQRHVQNAHLLAQRFGADGLGQRGVGQRFVPLGGAARPQHDAHAQPAVGQHWAHGVALVELVGGVGHKDHRELQPFGAVHRHDADAARPGLTAGVLGQAAVLPGGIHGADNPRQAGAPGRSRPGAEGLQVLPAAGTLRQGPHGS